LADNVNLDDQELFWSSDFGTGYLERNKGEVLIAANANLFSKVFSYMDEPPKSILELGANIGLNFLGISRLGNTVDYTGVEINPVAHAELAKLPVTAVLDSLFEYNPDIQFDLVFTKGVLIHLNPSRLNHVYETLYQASKKYLLVVEYYNPTPVEIEYRGHSGKLFKRDFAGEMLDKFSDLKLVSYGFCYHRDEFPQDDSTWFLMEKLSSTGS
jgi:spore coat polysaccharide biosynthesis protein SpsF